MAYQEVTTMGYGTRVGNSFKAIGTGILLFIIGTCVLWWNEGRAVKTEKMLDEAGSAYVEMENPNKKDASLEGELICGTALATTEDSLRDQQFGIAWLFYRPLLGISLLVLAGFLIWVFAFKGKDKLKELAAKAKERSMTAEQGRAYVNKFADAQPLKQSWTEPDGGQE